MAHGGGGRRSQELIRDLFGAAFDDPALHEFADAAVVEGSSRLAVTTDTYVVSPLEFRGGDIGKLAVYGTVNDLAMVGASPEYLTIGFVLEEGLLLETLWRIACSVRDAAADAGVRIVAGDTKVVERGRADGMYINTAGVGFVGSGVDLRASNLRPGDVALVSGDLGRHGIAVMAERAGIGFQTSIESDCAPLHRVAADLTSRVELRCMRDLTRGGLASSLVEIAGASGAEIEIDEAAIPVDDGVRGACEILGLDPQYVANEGRFVVFVPAQQAELALDILRSHDVSADAVRIGEVTDAERGRVIARTVLGSRRLVEMFSGEQLPRIC
jgi:hydrogenase expression/formation protein HypE